MKVILKVDDFSGIDFKPDYPWTKFLSVVNKLEIKISLGIIGKKMEEISDDASFQLQELYDKKIIQFYNHSYNHLEDPKIREFSGTSLNYQKESLRKNQEIIEAYFGYKMECFGAPQNSMDDIALKLLSEYEDIKYIYAYQESNSYPKVVVKLKKKVIIPLNGYGYLEHKKDNLHVNFNRFKTLFTECKHNKLITYQLHPSNWSKRDLEEFEQCIKFLKSQQCIFVFPTEVK